MPRPPLSIDLPRDVLRELEQASVAEGRRVEEFVRVAVEEKLADLRTMQTFRARAPWGGVPGPKRPRKRNRVPKAQP
jgi:hypothetical protein